MDSFAQLLDPRGHNLACFVLPLADRFVRREALPLRHFRSGCRPATARRPRCKGAVERAHRDQLRGSVGLPLVGGGAASGSQFSSPSVEPPFVRALCANRK